MIRILLIMVFLIGYSFGSVHAATNPKDAQAKTARSKSVNRIRIPKVKYEEKTDVTRQLLPKLAQEKLLRYEAKLLTPMPKQNIKK